MSRFAAGEEHPLPFSQFSAPTLGQAVRSARELTTTQIFGWLMFLASQNQRSTHLILKELRRMATNDTQLAQAVLDLTTAYEHSTDAIAAEITNLRGALQPDTDPAISDAVTKIEGIVQEMDIATANAQAAIAAPAAAPASSSASSTAPATGASSTAATSTAAS